MKSQTERFLDRDRIRKYLLAVSFGKIPLDRPQLQEALRFAVDNSDHQLFGVCADNFEIAIASLINYTTVLDCAPPTPLEPIAGVVYIKHNPHANVCYASEYEGRDRGVLISCQSADPTGINDTYGYFPLDLFATA